MIKIVKLFLYPFALLYDLITRFRNHLYDIGQKPSFTFDIPVVVVGNLNVGGSGKTPMIEYLIRLLKNNFAVATLSRGYRRNSTGYRSAKASDNARSIGDEPYQLFKKFGTDVQVVVGENRVVAIPNILQEFPDTNVILLDDAFQHRAVKPLLSILVTDYTQPFHTDFVMPLGHLREARKGAARANVIVVTKCDERITRAQMVQMKAGIQNYAGDKPVFFTGIRYWSPSAFGNKSSIERNIIMVSGIAKIKSFEEFCAGNYKVIRHFNFPDHHHYSTKDMLDIEAFYKSQTSPVSIVTTEKDMVKLLSLDMKTFVDRLPWFYLPIEQYFLEDGLKFDEVVLQSVTNALATE
ncbi:tetraacyldisaccharide 4'-kinase [soil metagenome]